MLFWSWCFMTAIGSKLEPEGSYKHISAEKHLKDLLVVLSQFDQSSLLQRFNESMMILLF